VRFGAGPTGSIVQRVKQAIQQSRQAPSDLWTEFKDWFPKQKARVAVGLEAVSNRIRTAIAEVMMGFSTSVPLPNWLYSRLERDYFFSPRKVMGVKFEENPELNEKIVAHAFQMAPRTKNLETLHSFYLPAKKDEATQKYKPTFVFFHGRDTNVGHLEELFKTADDHGYGFFAYDYPGFGKSEGVPTEKSLKQSAVAACRFLASDGYPGGYRVPYSDQILMGYSLGGGVASNVAKRFAKFAKDPASTKADFNLYGEWKNPEMKPRGLVLVNTFTSIPEVFKEKLKTMGKPVARWLNPARINAQFNSKKAVRSVDFPVRAYSCDNDSVIPSEIVEQLSDAAPNGRFKEIKGKGHGLHSKELQQIFDDLVKFDPKLLEAKTEAPARKKPETSEGLK
jgi:pimeloyl-ACP methyl ester carboxylesterase